MSSRLKEVEAMAELKDLRLKVMDLETQTHVYHNQLKRQGEDAAKLSDELEDRKKQEVELQTQLRSVQCLLCISVVTNISNYSNIRIVFHKYFYSYSYSCHFEVPNIIRIFKYLPLNSTNIYLH